jgi:hypothetical protein
MPASLPEGAPALILAVPSVGDDGLSGPTAEIATVLRVDNLALDVRTARINHGGRGDPDRDPGRAGRRRGPAPRGRAVGRRRAAAGYPASGGVRALREAIAASGVNASIGEVFNTNALLAEALHHRLADAGLARADRVRMFSITTSADGIILVTVGGEEAVGTASVTAFLLAARLALPVLAASLDAKPTVEDAAAQLEDMGVNRIALAPCVIGPEADPVAIADAAAAVGAKCCRAARRARQRDQAHLAGLRPGAGPARDARRLLSGRRSRSGSLAGQPAGRTAPMRPPGWYMLSIRTKAPVYGASTIMPSPM